MNTYPTTITCDPGYAPDPTWQCNAEPPKDGTTIVALGQVIIRDGERTIVDPFCFELMWKQLDSSFGGWVFAHDGMSLVTDPSDEVKIHWWILLPTVLQKCLPNSVPSVSGLRASVLNPNS